MNDQQRELGASRAILEDSEGNVMTYCLYARKSTEQDELQALSIDSQIKEMLDLANKEGLRIEEIRRESHSAKNSGQRPVFRQLLDDIRIGKFNGILCWAPDRLSRNAGDLGSVVDLIDQGHLVEIRTHSQKFTNNPNEKFLLMILGSQAKLENDHKGENVKRGLRAKCEQGWRPGMPPLGYLHDKFADKGQKRVFVDPERAPYIKQMFEFVAYENYSGRQLYDWLKKNKVTTKKGKNFTLSMIYRILADRYYYGEFEYPVGSGKIYKGGHDPIISRELYLKARENLTAPPRRHPGTVDFAFTKMLYCGNCGSGICAEEKFKHQKNGNVHRYVYYHCTRGKDRDCKEKPIREEELVRQLVALVDRLEVDQIQINEKIQLEIDRFRKFSKILGYNTKQIFDTSIDVKNYVKYVLISGNKIEKREMLESLVHKVCLLNKKIKLSN